MVGTFLQKLSHPGFYTAPSYFQKIIKLIRCLLKPFYIFVAEPGNRCQLSSIKINKYNESNSTGYPIAPTKTINTPNIMSARLKNLLLLPLLLLSIIGYAQETKMDYLKHGKTFNLCSFKRQCAHCFECEQQRFDVKIKNVSDKKITRIHYKFYSEVFNKIIEKEAKIQTNVIDKKNVAVLYICVPIGDHWIISNIEYEDGSSVKFTLSDRLESFLQEPDECECNPVYPKL
jgi:hypothetical protein